MLRRLSDDLRRGAALVSLVLAGQALPASAQSLSPGGNVIVPDGRTATSLSVSGATTDITTGTMAGGNAYNSFSRFEVGEQNTVNLHVPSNAGYLINIVRDAPVVVEGTLNGYKNGRIGGNVVFSDSHGFIVGEKGVVNAGSLTVNTPTRDFLDQVIDPAGNINTELGARLITGDVPLSPDGSIVIKGKINAKRGVSLKANSVTVDGPSRHQEVFEATVNTKGRKSGGQIVVRNGKIQIVAAGGGVRVAGKLKAGGGRKTAGVVEITSGADLEILPTARIEALRANEAETLFTAAEEVRRSSGGRITITSAGNLLVSGSIRAEGSVQAGGVVNLGGSDVVIRDGAVVTATSAPLPTSREAALAEAKVSVNATRDARIEGKIIADGAVGRSGGSIDVKAGNDIAVAASAELSASGVGVDADGGRVIVFADRNLSVADGFTLKAAAGTSGDGGFAELSARKVVELAGINMDLAGAGGGAAGTLLIDPEDVVIGSGSTPGVTYFGSRFTNGVNYILDAENSIVIKNGYGIDTRVLTNGVTSGNSGSVTLTAPTITIENGAYINTGVTAGSAFQAGDVTLRAEQSDTNDHWGTPGQTDKFVSTITVNGTITARAVTLSALAEYEVDSLHAGTTATINIGGTITGTTINVLSKAVARSNHNDSAIEFGILDGVISALNPLGLDAAWISADAKAHLNVSGSANISGSAVKLESLAIGEAVDASVGFSATKHLSVAVIVGMVKSDATTNIAQGARITTTDSLGVGAVTDTRLNVLSSVISGVPFVGSLTGAAGVGAVAYGSADVNANATIHSNATIGGTGSVTVLARSDNSFSVNAKVYGTGQTAAGGSMAISEVNSNTVARLGANVDNTASSTPKDVVVQAISNVKSHDTSASTTVGTALFSTITNGAGVVGNFLGGATPSVDGISNLIFARFMSSPAGAASSKLGVKGAAALSLAHGSITADASISRDAPINAAPVVRSNGDISVISDVFSGKIVSVSSAGVNSEAKDPTSAVTSAKVSAAVAVSIFDVGHYSRAYLGQNAEAHGRRVAVNAMTAIPVRIFLTDWDSAGQVIVDALEAVLANPNVITSGAKATSESTVASLAGSYNHFKVGVDTIAWVGKGAKVTSTAAAGTWQVGKLDAVGVPTTSGSTPVHYSLQTAIDILAQTSVESLNLMGNWGLSGSTSGGNAVGGSAGVVIFDVATVAGIADSAVATAASTISVDAKSKNYLVAVAPSNGSGGSIAGSGLVSFVQVDGRTHASVSNAADITADYLSVNAEERLNVYSGAGQVQYGNGTSIGVAIAIVDVKADTAAYIGHNIGEPGSNVDSHFATTGNRGEITVNDLSVKAWTRGQVVSASVAATLSQPVETPPAGSPGKAMQMLMSAQAISPSQFNLTISGSSSILLNELDTHAYVDGVDIRRRSGSAGTTLVEAINSLSAYSVSGSAAMSLGGPRSSGSAGIAGAIALGGSENATIAYIKNAKLTDIQNVVVQGLAGGGYTVSAVGLAASTGNDSLLSLAGSVSIALIEDTVQGYISASEIVAPTVSPGSVTAQAYRRTEISVGGGSLGLGGKGGAGIGLTYTTIRDADAGYAAYAGISNSIVRGYYDVNVVAASPSRIYSGAAAATVLTQNGFSGAIVTNDIGGTIMASIDADQSGKRVVAGRHVNVKSGTADADDLDAVLDAATSGANAAANDYSTVKYENAENGAVTEIAAGAAIVSIAGNIAFGDNNIGASVISNSIHQNHVARIAGVEVQADGNVYAAATDTTSILALGVGVGVATGGFAGQAAVVSNRVNSSISAEIGKSGQRTTIEAADVFVTAQDAVVIRGSATSASLSAGAAASVGIAVNSIGMNVGALVANSEIDTTGSVELKASSKADILTVAMGVSGGSGIALAGSAASSKIATNVRARVSASSDIDAENNVIVEARNSGRISVISGAAGVGLGAGGGGISVVVNEIGGDTEATIADSTVDADGDGADKSVQAGGLVSALSPGDVSNMGFSTPNFTQQTKSVSGVAVLANSTQTVTGVTVTLGIAGAGPAAAILPVITLAGGNTLAAIDSSSVGTRLGTASGVLVSAASHSYAGNLAIGGSASATGMAGTATNVATTMNRRTESRVKDSTLGAASAVAQPASLTVESVSSQSASDVAVGLAVGLVAGGTASGIVTIFNANTQSYVEGGTLRVGSARVSADSTNGYFAAAGAGAGGLFGGYAGAFVVGVSKNVTVARVGAQNKATTLHLNGDLVVDARSHNAFSSNAYGAAGSVIGAPVAGMALVTVVGNQTEALLRDATINIASGATVPIDANTTRPAGISVRAFEDLSTKAYTGGGAATLFGSGLGAAANVVVLTSKVRADSTGGNISAPGDFAISATTEKNVDAQTVTVGAGLGGGIGAAVAVVITGGATAAEAMAELNKDGSGTLANINALSAAAADFVLGSDTLSTWRSRAATAGNPNPTDAQVQEWARTRFVELLQAGSIGNDGTYIPDPELSSAEQAGALSDYNLLKRDRAGYVLADEQLVSYSSKALTTQDRQAFTDLVAANNSTGIMFTPKAGVLASYRQEAKTALGMSTDPTDEQVLAYLERRYRGFVAAIRVRADADYRALVASGEVVSGRLVVSAGQVGILAPQMLTSADSSLYTTLVAAKTSATTFTLANVDAVYTGTKTYREAAADALGVDLAGAANDQKVQDYWGARYNSLVSAVEVAADDAYRVMLGNRLAANQNFSVTNAASSASEGVYAGIGGGIVSVRDLSVDAVSSVSVSNMATGVGASGFGNGVGAAVAYTESNAKVQAYLAGNVTVRHVALNALAKDGAGGAAANTDAFAGAGGLTSGIGAAVAVSKANNNVSFAIAGTVNGRGGTSTLLANALDTTSIDSRAVGATFAGGVALGASIATSIKSSDVGAGIAAATQMANWSRVAIGAGTSGALYSQASAGAGGIGGAAAGAISTSHSSETVTASVGNGAHISAGSLSVAATARPKVLSEAIGVVVSGGNAMGVSVAESKSNAVVTAYVGDDVTVIGGGLEVTASTLLPSLGDTAWSRAAAGTGGVLFGANATVARSLSSSQVKAYAGGRLRLPNGNVSISAVNDSRQKTESTGIAVGFIGVGATVAETRSNGRSEAWLSDGAITAPSRTGALTVAASGRTHNEAKSTAGSGGVFAGAASVAITEDDSVSLAELRSGTAGYTLYTGGMAVEARRDYIFKGSADSFQASAIGASGAGVDNDLDSEVDAKIGAGMVIHATDNVYVTATTMVQQAGGGARAGSGGVVGGAAAAVSDTDITNDSRITIGDGTVISLNGDPTTFDGKIDIEVFNQLIAGDSVTVESGGYYAGGGASSELDAIINNTITVGNNAHLFSVGGLQVGTASVNMTGNQANASLYGVVTGAGANSFSRVNVTQQVNLGNSSTLEAFGNLTVTAGQSGNGFYSSLVRSAATTEVYNYALVPITALYRGDARAYNRVSVTMGTGGKLLAGRNILVGAYKGAVSAEGKGTNHNPYLAIFNATTTDNNSDVSTTAAVTLNGTVYAGINNSQAITIGQNGSVTLAARPYPYTLHEVPDAEVGNTFVSYNDRKLRYDISNTYNPYQDIVNHIVALTGLDPAVVRWRLATQNDIFSGVTVTEDVRRQVETFVRQIATGVPDRTVNTVEIGDIIASAGNVTVHADTLSGTATVTAKGAPRIDITNNGAGYVLLNKLLLTSNEGGHVTFTGAASATGGMTVSQETGPAKPEILIRSLYPGEVDHLGNVTIPAVTPDIYFLDDVSNLSGAVTVRNAIGNVTILSSLFEAAIVDMQVPRGNLTVNMGAGTIYDTNASVMAQWRNTQYRPSTAAQAVMAVASYWETASYNRYNGGAVGNDAEFTARTIVQSYFANGYNGLYSHVWFNLYDHDVDEDSIPTQTGQKSYWDEGWYRGAAYDQNDSSGPFGWLFFDVIQRQGLTHTASNASNPPAAGAVIAGGSIIMTAAVINVNGTLQSGAANSWSVNIGAAAQSTIESIRDNAAIRAANAGRFIELATDVNGLDSRIRAFYDVSNDRIELQNVVQGTGGRVYLNGGIMSTSTVDGSSQGLIRVNGGYATANIRNTTGTTLVVNTINTGVSTSSIVEIVDQFKLVNGSPTRVWYVYDVAQANAVSVYQQNGGTNTDYRHATLVGSSNNQNQVYRPADNLLYRWVETATAVRGMVSSPQVISNWQWESNAADPYTTTRSVITGYQVENFRETVTGSVTFQRMRDGNGADWWVDSSWGTDFKGHWYMDVATRATITLTNTVKASNPINIQFVGGSQGSVVVESNATVQVNGTITNYNGTTAITASGANSAIVSGREGFVSGRSVTLAGDGGIGTASKPVTVQLYGGTLNAATVDRDINIEARGKLSITAVKVNGSGLGDIDLRATGDITAASGYNIANPIIVGRSIRIDSASGAIGARSAVNANGQPHLADINPIVIQTRADGVLDSSSSTGTYLVQSKGDLRVGRVSSNGTVFLAAAASDGQAASILGGTSRAGPTAEETARLQAIWNTLNLLGNATWDGTYNPDGTANTEAYGGSAAVHGYEAMVNRAYQDYWQLRSLAYADGETYAISEIGKTILKAQIAANRPANAPSVSDTEVAAEAARRFGAAKFILGLSTDKSMVDLPQAQLDRLTGAPTTTRLEAALDAYDESFAYELDDTSELHALLTSGATWTQDQLTYTIDSAANPASNTPVPTLAQIARNIDGREIILYAPNGSIGSLAPSRVFTFTSDNPGALSAVDRAAISAAGPGDLQVSTRALAGGATEYTITLAEHDLVVASALGSIAAKAKSAIYLGSHEDLNLGGVAAGLFPAGALSGAYSAGVQTTNGGVIRLEAIGDVAAGVAGEIAISGNISRLTLISESGSIGRAGLPGVNPALNNNALLVAMTGGGTLDLAQAAQGIYLRQTTGDLILGNIAGGSGSQAAVQLAANGSIYAQAQFTDRTVPHILGSSLDLRAGGAVGFNGTSLQPLQVSITGAVTGSAEGDFTLLSPTSSLTIGTGSGLYDSVRAGGRLVLSAAGGALTVNRSIQAGTGLELFASSVLALADHDEDEDLSVVVKSIAGDLVASAGSIVMGTLSRIEGAGLVTVSATGNARLGVISSTLDVVANAATPVISITAGLTGSILGNGDAVANLVTAATGGVALSAGSSIDLVTNTGWLTASATTGDVDIEAVAGLEARSLTATLGAVRLIAPGLLDVGTVIAGTSASIGSSGGGIKLASLTTGTTAALDAGTDIEVTTLTTGTSADLDAGGSIDVDTLAIGTALTSNAGATTTVGTVTAGTSMNITSAGLVDITIAGAASGSAALRSTGGGIVLGSLAAGIDAGLQAGTTIAVQSLRAGASVVVAAPSATLGDVQAAGDVSISAANTLGATSLVAGGLVTIDNAGSILVGRLVARELIADGGASFDATEISLGERGRIAADEIQVRRLAHTGTSGRFGLDITGRNGSAANFAAFISAPYGIEIGDYSVATSTIDTDASFLSIARGYVTGTFTLKTALRKIFMDNRSPRPVKGFDVQLFQPTFAFRLRQDGYSTTTNAFIVQFGEGSEVFFESNGAVYAGMSMLREFDRMAGAAMASGGVSSPLWPGTSLAFPSASFMTRFLHQQTLESMLIREDEDEPAVNLDAAVINSIQQ